MKTYIGLFLTLVGATCGVMLTEGATRGMFQVVLFAVVGVIVLVLVTGVLD